MQDSRWQRWQGLIIILLCGGILTAVLTYTLATRERQHIMQQQHQRLELFEQTFSRFLLKHIFLAEWLNADIRQTETDVIATLSKNAVNLHRYYPAIEQIYWLPTISSGLNVVRKVLPSRNLLSEDEVARIADSVRTSKILDTPMGSAVIAHNSNLSILMITRYENASGSGFVVLSLSLPQSMEAVINNVLVEGDQLRLYDEDKLSYQFAGEFDLYEQWVVERSLRIAERTYLLQLWPTKVRLAELRSTPYWLLWTLGLLLTFVVFAIVLFQRRAQQRYRGLHQQLQIKDQQFTEQESQLYQLRALANLDPITRLHNRSALVTHLHKQLNQQQTKVSRASIIQLRVNHLDKINQTLSIKTGDELLRRLAHRIQEHCTNQSYVARSAGNDFVVLINEFYTEDQAHAAAASLIDALKAKFYVHNYEIFCSFAAAVKLIQPTDRNAEELLQELDKLTAAAQQYGYFVIQQGTVEATQLQHQQHIAQQLFHSVAEPQLELHYQPILDLKKNKPIALEVLLRWRQPDQTLLRPEQFFDLIEDTGLIIPLTDRFIKESFEQLNALNQAGLTHLRMHLNFTRKQLALPDLAQTLKTYLLRYDIHAGQIAIEIKDDVFYECSKSRRSLLTQLQSLGIALVIEIQGLSHPTLQVLDENWAQMIKIDRQLIEAIPGKHNQSQTVNLILEVAQKQQLATIAVGIENQQQVDFLSQRQCPYGQGYYLCRPLNSQHLLSLLTQPLQSPDAGEHDAN